MTYKCLIADDEMPARELLADYVNQLPQLELVAKCKNGVEVIKALQEDEIQILFLDIQMPHLKGTEVVKSVANLPAVIFTTAYEQYAIQAFDLNAVDYLLKPFSFDRFVQSVNKAIEKLSGGAGAAAEAEANNFIMVKSEHKLIKIKYEDIVYIEALREYIRIFTGTEQVVTLETMKNMETVLPPNLFIRIHKSFIVAFDRIKALQGNQVEIADKVLPIGRSYRKQLMDKFSA